MRYAGTLLLSLVFFLAGCSKAGNQQPPAAAAQPPDAAAQAPALVNIKPDVTLQFVNNGTELKVTTPGNPKCRPVNQVDGCVHVGTGETAEITFKLSGSNRYFKTFRICKGNEKASQDCSLNGEERTEFWVSDGATLLLPNAVGEIDLGSLSAGKADKFALFDKNTFAGEYFYSIEACMEDMNENASGEAICLWTDPPVENKGRR